MPCLKSEVVLLDLEELLGPNQNYFQNPQNIDITTLQHI